MIATTPEHRALLASRVFFACDLHEFELLDGTLLRYASGGLSMVWDGLTYQAGGPIIERGEVRAAIGLEADSATLNVFPREGSTLLGLPWHEAVANGALDGARYILWRAHAATPGAPVVGAVRLFGGDVGIVRPGLADGIEIEITSELAVLDRKIPRAVFGPGCDRTLFDAGCGLSRAAHMLTGAVLAGSEPARILTAVGAAAGTYNKGELRLISGASAGARRTIKRHEAGGALVLAYPLPRGVVAGDSFQLWPGCDGTFAACTAFGNTGRFRGQPDVPAPETAY